MIAGSNQAEQAAVPRCAFADGVDVRVATQAGVVDHHATARADLQRALAGQRILRADTGGEHDQIGFEEFVVGEIHPIAEFFAGTDRLRGAGQVHTDAQPFDLRLERQPTEVIQLHRHQARREFHYVRFKAQAFQGIGRFEAEQSTADYHAALGIGCCGTDRIKVFEGAVYQTRIAFGAFDRRHKRVGAGGQHQFVVGEATLRGDHLTTGTIDFQHRHAQVQRDTRRLVQRRVTQRQRLGIATGKILGQMHTVVSAHRLFAENVQPIAVKGAALDQLLDTMMPDHAIADHDQRLMLVQCGYIGIHKRPCPKPITVQKAKKNA
ncbi:hypothetical protein D3C71_1286710 [compost metagenome]